MRPTHVRHWLIAALCATGLLSGCSDEPSSSDAGTSDRVATIAGGPTAKPSPSPETGAMLRIDMTEEDRDRVYDAYWACLESHGVKMVSKAGSEKVDMPDNVPVPKVPEQENKKNRSGYAACKDKEPYLDPLLDKARNPNYPDQTRAWMKCMNNRGIEVSGNWDDEFFSFGKRAPGIDSKKYLEIYRECEMQSYRW
ncbi:hypothetical protein [Jidongwangia harbinensis]|uniref:hypothetical protein n=1 Tax=Jidongwangia harbinensis TaxID=2878561 RepID=UPI001CDA24E4|nr:hypothetical protein [Jidongwangia harbinensis]MCA2219095.1 hypothetical protein [Jidongwangia harbinensis]